MKKIVPFGAGYAESFNPEPIPDPENWAWKPDPKADVSTIQASWPGSTCTRNTIDERPDEMMMRLRK